MAAPRHSVSSAATPYQHGQSTTTQPNSLFAVPATPPPRGSTEHRSGNNVVSGGPQLASASDSRRGHTTSGTTPVIFRTHPTSKVSESKQSLDPQISKALEGLVVQVKTEAFVRAVLYKDPETMGKDARLAAQYLELFQTESLHEGRAGGDPTDSSPQQPTIPPPSTSHPTESTLNGRPSTPGVPPHQKPLLRKSYTDEDDMYTEHVERFNSISCFFQGNKKDVDQAWLPAQPPEHGVSQYAGPARPPLNRVFQDTHDLARSFSRYDYGQGGLKPDLCFLIEPEGEPKESEPKPEESEPKPEESKPKPKPKSKPKPKPKSEESKPKPEESKPKPEESKPKPKSKPEPEVTAHWKDVLVPVELKKYDYMTKLDLVQVAQYARSIMVEQYDRTFALTVLITGRMCRVFHWDAAGAQVTEAFDIHENTQLFVQVMGRLATMTPSELGYDTHFSNAGRVRSTDKIDTHLTIHLSQPRAFPNHAIPSPTPDCTLVVKLKEMLFESTGGLFSRATRVWRTAPVNDPPPDGRYQWSESDTFIVKQNWADDKRPNEGIFHTLAKDVAAVPELVGMQELQFTHSFRTRFEKQELLKVARVAAAKIPRGDGPGASDSAMCGREVRVAIGSGDVGSGDVGSGGASEHLSAADIGEEEDVVSNKEDLRDWEDVRDEEVRAEDAVEQKVANEADTGNKEPLERVLLRFVFKGRGRQLSKALDSIDLLEAAAQWVPGLVELDDIGITHRDISYGNLLLPLLQTRTPQASIIDLGLAHLKHPEKIEGLVPAEALNQGTWADRPHHHVTGTLPFVALELLGKADTKIPCKHGLHHDLESVFWVLLYTCIKHHGRYETYLGRVLRGMTSPDPHSVFNEKTGFLAQESPLHNMRGPFEDLGPFLTEFGNLCKRKEEVLKAEEVKVLISKELEKLREKRRGKKRRPESPPENDPAAKRQASSRGQ